MVAPRAFLTSVSSRIVAQSAFSGSTLTIGAAVGLVVVGVGFAVVVGVGFGVVVGLTTTTLLNGLDVVAALLVTVLTTVTVRFVVDPELQAATVRATASKGTKAVRRMGTTLCAVAVNIRSTRRDAQLLFPVPRTTNEGRPGDIAGLVGHQGISSTSGSCAEVWKHRCGADPKVGPALRSCL